MTPSDVGNLVAAGVDAFHGLDRFDHNFTTLGDGWAFIMAAGWPCGRYLCVRRTVG